MFISQSVKLISDNILIGRNFDSYEFDSTGVKLYIFIHNEVRDFDTNSTQPEIRVNRIRDNESQLHVIFSLDFVLRKPYYLHSLSLIYLSKHVYYLRIKIGSQVKHPVIEFDIFTLGYFTCLIHNLSN
jgi:hypothetical protein